VLAVRSNPTLLQTGDSLTYGTSPTELLDDLAPIQREIEWEHGAVERGVRRYREQMMRERKDGSMVLRDLAELEPGQEIMRDVVRKVHEKIAETALIARNALANKGRGRDELWWWPMLSLDPDKIALIGARALLCSGHWGSTVATYRALRSAALEIGRHAQVEREFEMWSAAQAKQNREAKKRGEWVPDYWKWMRELAPELTERAFRKWAKKSGRYDRVDWPREMRLHFGLKVAHLIAETCPEWFTIEMPGRVQQGRYRTEKIVSLTARAREWVAARHQYNEMRRPWFVPMLVEPLDWKRVQHEEKKNGQAAVGDPQDEGSAGDVVAGDGQPDGAE
jgi:hypothetical protein